MPLLPRYIGLGQQALQQRNPYIRLVRIRNVNIDVSSRHKLMSTTRKRPREPERLESSYQLMTRNRLQPLHAASKALRSYLRIDGTNCCFRTLRSSHSSSTSWSCAKASFFVRPCAHTPLKEGRETKYGKGSSIFSIFAFAITSATYCVNMRSLYHIRP